MENMALTSTNEDNNDKEQPKTKKHISKSRIYIYILKTEKKLNHKSCMYVLYYVDCSHQLKKNIYNKCIKPSEIDK